MSHAGKRGQQQAAAPAQPAGRPSFPLPFLIVTVDMTVRCIAGGSIRRRGQVPLAAGTTRWHAWHRQGRWKRGSAPAGALPRHAARGVHTCHFRLYSRLRAMQADAGRLSVTLQLGGWGAVTVLVAWMPAQPAATLPPILVCVFGAALRFHRLVRDERRRNLRGEAARRRCSRLDRASGRFA